MKGAFCNFPWWFDESFLNFLRFCFLNLRWLFFQKQPDQISTIARIYAIYFLVEKMTQIFSCHNYIKLHSEFRNSKNLLSGCNKWFYCSTILHMARSSWLLRTFSARQECTYSYFQIRQLDSTYYTVVKKWKISAILNHMCKIGCTITLKNIDFSL